MAAGLTPAKMGDWQANICATVNLVKGRHQRVREGPLATATAALKQYHSSLSAIRFNQIDLNHISVINLFNAHSIGLEQAPV